MHCIFPIAAFGYPECCFGLSERRTKWVWKTYLQEDQSLEKLFRFCLCMIASRQLTFQMFYSAPWILPFLLSLGSCIVQKKDCGCGVSPDLEVVENKLSIAQKFYFDNQNFICKLNIPPDRHPAMWNIGGPFLLWELHGFCSLRNQLFALKGNFVEKPLHAIHTLAWGIQIAPLLQKEYSEWTWQYAKGYWWQQTYLYPTRLPYASWRQKQLVLQLL